MIERKWDMSDEQRFVEATLLTYLSLPQARDKVDSNDRLFAKELYQLGYELYNVEAALLLGSVRKSFARHSVGWTVNLKEFEPYVKEVGNERLDINYVRYLRHLLLPVLKLGEEKPGKK